MKKLFALFIAAILSQASYSQVTYEKLVKAIQESYPGIDTKNKIIAVNFWSKSDQKAREANMQLEKTFNIYQGAKLRGGQRGMIAVTINENDNKSESDIYLSKDGVTKLLSIDRRSAGRNVSEAKNLFFDSNGQEILRNVEASEMVMSVNQFITR